MSLGQQLFGNLMVSSALFPPASPGVGRIVMDSWGDLGEQSHLQAAGNGTLPVLTVTAPGLGWRTVIRYIVPAGKFYIPLWANCSSDGTLQSLVRVSRRDHLWAYAATAIVDPVVPADPTISAGNSFGMNIGSYSYKHTIINSVGETLPTAATGAVSTTQSTDGLTVPLVAIAGTGGTYRRLYRTRAGQGVTGPWFLLHEIDDTVGGYTDTHPDSDLLLTVQPPSVNTTASGAAGVTGRDNPSITPVADLVLNVERIALTGGTVLRIVYVDEDGLQENVTVTPTVTADSQTTIPLKRQGIGITSAEFDQLSRSAIANFRGGDVNLGLKQINAVAGNPVAGSYNIYGYLPLLRGPQNLSSAAVAGGNDRQTTFAYQTECPAGTEIVVEVAHPPGTVAAAQNYIIDCVGRLLTV